MQNDIVAVVDEIEENFVQSSDVLEEQEYGNVFYSVQEFLMENFNYE